MIRLPKGPLVASVLLVAAGLVLLARNGGWTQRNNSLPFTELKNPLRIVSWDMTGTSDSRSVDEIANTLMPLAPHLVTLHHAPDAAFCDAVGHRLGATWRVASIGMGEGRKEFMAVLIHPDVVLLEQRLLSSETSNEALAVSTLGPLQRLIRLACLTKPGGDASTQQRYLDRVLSWAEQETGGLTVLIGLPSVSSQAQSAALFNHPGNARKRLSENFLEIVPEDLDGRPAQGESSAIYLLRTQVRARSFRAAPLNATAERARPIVTEIEIQ